MLNETKVPLRIDTHRHLGGSIPVSWVWDVIQRNNWYHLAINEHHVKSQMTFSVTDKRSFANFLSKFDILNHIPWTEDLIDSMVKAVADEITGDHIDYCWLDFTIDKYLKHLKWSPKQAITFLSDRFEEHLPGKVGLILSLKYESLRDQQREIASIIDDNDIVTRLFGLDLVGNEYFFDLNFYRPIFRDWSIVGKMTRAHVAESQKSHDGLNTIINLDIKHIAHGLYMTSDREAMRAAKDLDVVFDLGLTSNRLTGVWDYHQLHPISIMLEHELKVTLGTDDPVQCQTNLDQEYNLARFYGIQESEIVNIQKSAELYTKKFLE